ncbi:MAG: IS1634 family transposase [Actinobacteria bacterium]|nr:IS1634 family transposase [Actinomycetota bacterium]
MYIRVKTSNNNRTTFVQIVQSVRAAGRVSQRIVRHIGVAKDDTELEKLKILAESIRLKLEARGQQYLFKPEEVTSLKRPDTTYESSDYNVNLANLVEEQRLVAGIHEAYGKLFDDLGYVKVISSPSRNKMMAEVFKNIVLARIANPASKRASVLKLEEDFGLTINLDRVYRMMDKLDDPEIERLKKITYENTLGLLGQKINVIFYDATTIYFESFDEDELKANGFSKDCKHNQPQVLLALMVTTDGLPVDYEVFAGNTFEGSTLIPALTKVRQKYDIEKVVFVADSAMLSKDNIAELESLKGGSFSFIVGARLKNLNISLKSKILDINNYKETTQGLRIGQFDLPGKKLIVSFSAKRARKDSLDRKKAIEKLKAKLEKSKSIKANISNNSYRKYLKIQGSSSIELDEDKIEADSAWDGLHGVVTNSELPTTEVLEKYKELYHVEAAFRVTKHDLAVRPVYHWKPERIKAHIAICYCAYCLVKQMEYRVSLQYEKLSIEVIRELLMHVQTSVFFDRKKKIRYAFPSSMKKDAKKIYNLLGIKRNLTPYIIEKL